MTPRITDSDDANRLAALVAERYRSTIVENVVPARVETVTQTVLADEPFVRSVAAEPSNFKEAMILDFRMALAFAVFALRLVIALLRTLGSRAFDSRFSARVGEAFRSAWRTERSRLSEKLRSIHVDPAPTADFSTLAEAPMINSYRFREATALTFRRALAFAAFAFRFVAALFRALGRGVREAYRSARRTERRRLVEKLRRFLTVRKTEYRKVERTLEYEMEMEPERVVETVETPSKRLLTLGRGGINFRASRTVGGGALLSGPSALTEPKRVRFPMLNETSENVLDAVSSMESALLRVPWALDGEARRYDLPDDAPLKLQSEALSLDLFIKPGGGDSPQADHVPMRGIERALMEHAEYMSQAFSDRRDAAFSFDNILTNPRLIGALVPMNGAEGGEGRSYPSVVEFTDLAESKAETDLQDLAERWPARQRDVLSALFAARSASLCDQLAEESLDFTMSVGESAFNMYCPDCNSDLHATLDGRTYDVQSDQTNEPLNFSANTRCVLDYDENGEKVWRCVACENETYIPIPVHKMLDELLLPVYDRLMNENQVERLRAHRDARNKEIEYRTAMRTESETSQFDNLRRMESLAEEMQRLQVDIQGDDAALESLRAIMIAYDTRQDAELASVRATGARVENDIRIRTEQAMRRVDGVKEEQMRALDEENFYFSKAKREDDERRDNVQIAILDETREQRRESRKRHEEKMRLREEDRKESRMQREEDRKERAKSAKQTNAIAKQHNDIIARW